MEETHPSTPHRPPIGRATIVRVLGLGFLIPWFPPAAATQAHTIDTLYYVLIIVTVPIFVLVTSVVLLSAWKWRMRPGEERLDGPPIHGNTQVGPLRETLTAAIHSRTVLRLSYADDSGKQSRRDVQPLALHFWGAVWTLAAWCRLRQDFRSFRLDRIRTAAPTGDTFTDRPGQTLADFLRAAGVR